MTITWDARTSSERPYNSKITRRPFSFFFCAEGDHICRFIFSFRISCHTWYVFRSSTSLIQEQQVLPPIPYVVENGTGSLGFTIPSLRAVGIGFTFLYYQQLQSPFEFRRPFNNALPGQSMGYVSLGKAGMLHIFSLISTALKRYPCFPVNLDRFSINARW